MIRNSSKDLESRELPGGARQSKELIELALELLPEIIMRSRSSRKPTVIVDRI